MTTLAYFCQDNKDICLADGATYVPHDSESPCGCLWRAESSQRHVMWHEKYHQHWTQSQWYYDDYFCSACFLFPSTALCTSSLVIKCWTWKTWWKRAQAHGLMRTRCPIIGIPIEQLFTVFDLVCRLSLFPLSRQPQMVPDCTFPSDALALVGVCRSLKEPLLKVQGWRWWSWCGQG